MWTSGLASEGGGTGSSVPASARPHPRTCLPRPGHVAWTTVTPRGEARSASEGAGGSVSSLVCQFIHACDGVQGVGLPGVVPLKPRTPPPSRPQSGSACPSSQRGHPHSTTRRELGHPRLRRGLSGCQGVPDWLCVCVRGCLSLWGVSVSGSLSLRGWLLQHLRGALCPSLCDCVCGGVVAISLRRGFVSVSLRVCLSDMSGRGDFYRLEGELTAGGVQTSPQPLSVSASLAGYPSYRASLGPIVGAQAPTLRLGRSGWDLGLPPRGGR